MAGKLKHKAQIALKFAILAAAYLSAIAIIMSSVNPLQTTSQKTLELKAKIDAETACAQINEMHSMAGNARMKLITQLQENMSVNGNELQFNGLGIIEKCEIAASMQGNELKIQKMKEEIT